MTRPGSSAPRSARRRPAADSTLALAGAAGLGAAAVTWSSTMARGFGQAPDTVMTLGVVGMLALTVGTYLDFRPPSGRGPRAGRAAGWKLAAAGVVTALAAAAAPFASRMLMWTGAHAGAPEWGVALARAAVGALLLLPAGIAAGAAVRAAARELAGGERTGALLAATVPAAAAGALAAGWLGRAAAPAVAAAVVGGSLAAVGLLAVASHRGTHASSLEPAGEDAGKGADAWCAATAAFGLAAFSFLGARALVPAFGNELPGTPAALALFVAAVGAGGLLAAGILRFARDRIPAGAPGAVLLVAALAALPTIHFRFDDVPARFAEAAGSAEAYGDILRAALFQGAALTAPVALLLGLAAALLLGSVPAEPRDRPAWIARCARAAAAGAAVGLVAPRLAVPSLEIAGAVLLAAGLLALGGAASFAGHGGRRPARVAAAVLALAGAGLLVARSPAPDRAALRVEADLVPASSLVSVIPKHWAVYDRDGMVDSVTLLKRGHSRRLLVNGRFESGSVSEIKSHGLLLHLPLVLQVAPERVCLLGAGNGRSLAAALSHPVSQVDVLVRDRVALGALRQFGPHVPPLLADERVRFLPGDPRDLLERSAPFDVISNHVSGTWTATSARTSTREFLALVRDRLTDRGIYSHLVPGNSLTKEGFLVLLRTVSEVFPQVELWAGQGGDVVVLAKRNAAPHDFRVLLEPFRNADSAVALRDAWLADPVTLLSQFLVGDEAVRRLAARSVTATIRNAELGAAEARRRLETFVVDPVPGLAELGGDVTLALVNSPGPELKAAMGPALEARRLERAGVEAEIRANANPAAMTNARIGALDEAAQIYRRGLDLNPRDGALRRALASARSSVGIAYSSKLAFTAAYSNMLRAVEIDSTYAQGFANLGLLLAENEDYGYADATTAKALELAPDDDLLYHQRARIWKRRRFYDRALPYYEKAMEINPLNVEAVMGYTDARLSMDLHPDLEGNLELLLECKEIEPDNEELDYRIGRIREVMEVGLEYFRPELREQEEEEDVPMLLREVPDSTGADSTGAVSTGAD